MIRKGKTTKNNQVAAIILAAGEGVRMNSKKVNKVMIPIAGKPMISYTIGLLRKVGVGETAIVVGFAKDSVKKLLGPNFLYVEQKKRLGTAHAVECALEKIPTSFRRIIVLNGDDSAFYQSQMIKGLIEKSVDKKAALTFLTIETDKPWGLGRVFRAKDGKVLEIVEEKDATISQRKIKEVNPACYIFQRAFLENYLSKVEKSPVSGEYYLTDLIKLGVKNGERIEGVKMKNVLWRGVNTPAELKKAEKMMRRLKGEN